MTTVNPLSEGLQRIDFIDEEMLTRTEVTSKNIEVHMSLDDTNCRGSSHAKLKNIVDYSWEQRYYPGQLLAVHKGRQYIAYSIKVGLGPGSAMVRILNSPAGKKVLIKGMKGEIQDLGFSYLDNEIVLACIDDRGNILVNRVEDCDGDKLIAKPLLQAITENEKVENHWHRIFWCPFIPETEDDSNDPALAFISLHSNQACCWRVNKKKECSAEECAGLSVNGRFVCGAISPDGTAIALADTDGFVLFYQIMDNPHHLRILHKWMPHGGKPLSSIFFLDNYTSHTSNAAFWKYAMTGAEHNTTLKLWSCTTWSCVQTLRFPTGVDTTIQRHDYGMNTAMDFTSSYLLLSDYKNRCIYVVEFDKTINENEAYFKALLPIRLPYPILSLAVSDASIRQRSASSDKLNGFGNDSSNSDDDNDDINDDYYEDPEMGWCAEVVIHGYSLQSRALQKVKIIYRLNAPITPPLTPFSQQSNIHSPMLHQSPQFIDVDEIENGVTETTTLEQHTETLKSLLLRSQPIANEQLVDISSHEVLQPINLMTPNAYSTERIPMEKIEDVAAQNVPVMATVSDVECAAGANKLRSHCSSPSREVEEILCPYETQVSENIWPHIPLDQLKEAIKMTMTDDVKASNSLLTQEELLIERNQFSQELRASIDRLTAAIEDQSRVEALEFKVQQLTDVVRELSEKTSASMRSCGDGENERSCAAAAARTAGAGAARALEPLVAALQTELSNKLTATDKLLAQNIHKLATSKNVTEGLVNAISHNVTQALTKTVHDSWRVTLATTLLPAIENSFQNTFAQINNVFVQGTKEYAKKIEEVARSAVERGEGAATLKESLLEHAAALKRMEQTLQTHQHNMCNSPAPHQIVSSLLESGDTDGAFQKALSASDLPLVVSLCRNANPFRTVPKLQVHVLLSLVQQLGADLTNDTKLKRVWLEEAVKRLSIEARGQKHAPVVLNELQVRLTEATMVNGLQADLGLLLFVVRNILLSLPSTNNQ